MTASMVVDLSPFLRWSLAIIAGGGVAGIVQGGTAVLRAVSSGTTGGMANPVFSTLEWIGSIVMTVLAVVAPLLAGLLVVAVIVAAVIVLRRFWGFWRKRQPAAVAADAGDNTV